MIAAESGGQPGAIRGVSRIGPQVVVAALGGETTMNFGHTKTVINHLLMLVSSSIVLACAGAGPAPDEADLAEQSGRVNCISGGTVRDYTVLDDANLIVTAGAKRRYHVELQRRAFGLRSAWQIGFTSSTNRICAGFSEVLYNAGVGSFDADPEKIRIRSIRRLTPEEEDTLLIRSGKKEPEIEHTPVHEPVESAEVEELD